MFWGSPEMDWHPVQGGVEILLVASCKRKWNERWPDGSLDACADLTSTSELPFAERVLVENVSHENHLIFRMNVQVTYFHTNSFALRLRRFATEAKVKLGLGYSSMNCHQSSPVRRKAWKLPRKLQDLKKYPRKTCLSGQPYNAGQKCWDT